MEKVNNELRIYLDSYDGYQGASSAQEGEEGLLDRAMRIIGEGELRSIENDPFFKAGQLLADADRITLGLGVGLKAKLVKNGILSFDIGPSIDFSKTVAFDNYYDQITKAEASFGAYLNLGPVEAGGSFSAFASETAWGPTIYDTDWNWSGVKVNSDWSTGNIKFNEFEGTFGIFKVGFSWDD